MSTFATLSGIVNNAYILFCFALGIWSSVVWFRGGNLGGQFWGAMWTCTGMAAFNLLLWFGRAASGENLRWVYILYELYFIIVLPGTFALLRGRDDRVAAGIFAVVTIFSAFAAISAGDPSRHVIAPLPMTPTPFVG